MGFTNETIEQDAIVAVETIALSRDIDLRTAAALYMLQVTGLSPIIDTIHGPFRFSYEHCMKVTCLSLRGEKDDVVKGQYQATVNDFIWVWEHPLLKLR